MTKERYFDDLKAGDRFKSEPLEVTEKQVIEFAHKFDPQMFHLTRKSAERTIFKGLIASGWHTAAMTMRLFVQTLNFVEGAIGLGVDELRWPNPVRPRRCTESGDRNCRSSTVALEAGLRNHSAAERDHKSARRNCADHVRKRNGARARGLQRLT